MEKLNILLMCFKQPYASNANTVLDHISAFEQYSKHNLYVYSNHGTISKKLALDRFDVVILHYSVSLLFDVHISLDSRQRLRDFKGLKVVFIQDEYRQIDKMNAALHAMKIDVLFTCFPESEIEKIYPKEKLPTLSKYNNLTGYVPEALLNLPVPKKINERVIDVGYRGRNVPFFLGALAYEKYSIVDQWNKFTQGQNLTTDISYHEQDRIYGEEWIHFMSSCKATLGVESGASVMDFSGKLEKLVGYHQAMYPEDSFEEIQEIYFKQHEGKHKLNQISPRCFEAIVLKTAMVLYEGEYSNALVPDRHYIALKKDFSNIEDVLLKLKDNASLQCMVDRAFNEIALNSEYSYKTFVLTFDRIMAREFLERNKPRAAQAYEVGGFKKAVKKSIRRKMFDRAHVVYGKCPDRLRLIVQAIAGPKESIDMLYGRRRY